jgi:hypothetical protein
MAAWRTRPAGAGAATVTASEAPSPRGLSGCFGPRPLRQDAGLPGLGQNARQLAAALRQDLGASGNSSLDPNRFVSLGFVRQPGNGGVKDFGDADRLQRVCEKAHIGFQPTMGVEMSSELPEAWRAAAAIAGPRSEDWILVLPVGQT